MGRSPSSTREAPHPGSTTTAATVGADAPAEDIMARLLEGEGYASGVHEPSPTALTDKIARRRVRPILLALRFHAEAREAILEAIRGTPRRQATI